LEGVNESGKLPDEAEVFERIHGHMSGCKNNGRKILVKRLGSATLVLVEWRSEVSLVRSFQALTGDYSYRITAH
jgi:hypothetical protein